MSQRNTQLDDLRRQIDSLDDRIHDLLIERSAMIEQIIAAKRDGAAKLRPGREAEIARRLVGRHRGHFPAPSLVRIWREIINAFTCMQGPFSIAVPAGEADRPVRELARDHFGGTPARVSAADAVDALRRVAAGEVTLAVLPWSDRSVDWLGAMIGADDPGLQICFGLPFVRIAGDADTKAVAVGKVVSEPTDDDRSVWVIEDSPVRDPAALDSVARRSGLELLGHTWAESASLSYCLLEIAGRPDRDAAAGLAGRLGVAAGSVRVFGAFAQPILLSSEE